MSGVRFYGGEIGTRDKCIFNVFADQARKHLAHLGNDDVQLEEARLQHLHAAEGQQLARHGNSAVRGFFNLIQTAFLKIIGPLAIDEQIAVASNDGQQIVEIMRYAACESAYGLHLVSLAEPLLELLLLFLHTFHAGAHADESFGDFGDFISAAAFQHIVEIALLQCTNPGDQARQRPRESMGDQEDKAAAGQNAEQAQANQDVVQFAKE